MNLMMLWLWVLLRLFIITHLHLSSPLSSYEVIGCYVTQCLSVPVALWVCRHQPAAAASLRITVWMTKEAVERWSLLMWRTSTPWDTQHAIHLKYTQYATFCFSCQVEQFINLSLLKKWGVVHLVHSSSLTEVCFNRPPLGSQSEAGVREFHIVQVSSSSQHWRLQKCINPAKDKGGPGTLNLNNLCFISSKVYFT